MARRASKRPRSNRGPATDAGPRGVRLIGGELRGRVLAFDGQDNTRPMKDRTREAVFNLIGPRSKGRHAVDLFAGTGALGFEALSRGAAAATFVEQHFPTARLIERSATMLKLTEHVEVITSDTFFWVEKTLQKRPLPTDMPWLVFCSPPYSLFVDRLEDMCSLLDHLIKNGPDGSIFVVEADDRFDMQRLDDAIDWDVRRYSPATVAIGDSAESSGAGDA